MTPSKDQAIVATTTEDDPLRGALISALAWDKLSEPQREVAFAIAKRYELDPMLRHLVLIEGRPYITRDGLLHVAHRSGDFDGIETDPPVLGDDGYYRTIATVYRKSFGRPFKYPGRYPAKGRNAAYGEEMAIKVAEVMTLRRAFDVAAPVVEERWSEGEVAEATGEEPASLTDRIVERAASLVDGEVAPTPPEVTTEPEAEPVKQPESEPEPVVDAEVVAAQEQAPGEPVATTDEEMTLPRFSALVEAAAIPKDTIRTVAKQLFPDKKSFATLTSDELSLLWSAVSDADPVAPEAAPAEPTVNGAGVALCGEVSPLSGATCTLDAGHPSKVHRAGVSESW